MFRRIGLTVVLVLALCAWAGTATAAPIVLKATLTGDPRPVEPDDILIDVTITWDPDLTPYDALWTVDLNSPLHPDAKLGSFGFNMLGLGSDYTFSGCAPAAWSISGPTFVPGTGGMEFMFVANDPALPGNDVTNSVDLVFTMTKSGSPLVSADFLAAPVSCSNDAALSCHQLAAHVQSLAGGASGAAVGDYVLDLPRPVPEPASLILFGSGLIAAASARRLRRKK